MTLQQCICDIERAKHHLSERDKERHPIIGLTPEDHTTDDETDQRRQESKHEREGGIAADRETRLLHCLRGVSGGLHKSTRRTGTHSLELRKVRRKESDEDSQSEDDQCDPDDPVSSTRK